MLGRRRYKILTGPVCRETGLLFVKIMKMLCYLGLNIRRTVFSDCCFALAGKAVLGVSE